MKLLPTMIKIRFPIHDRDNSPKASDRTQLVYPSVYVGETLKNWMNQASLQTAIWVSRCALAWQWTPLIQAEGRKGDLLHPSFVWAEEGVDGIGRLLKKVSRG